MQQRSPLSLFGSARRAILRGIGPICLGHSFLNGMSLTLPSSYTDRLSDMIPHEFGDDRMVSSLLARFLQNEIYQRQFCLDLLAVARGERPCSWAFRRLAILMLEHQLLKLSQEEIAEYRILFTEMGILNEVADRCVTSEVLKEGYSTTEMSGFVREFKRRLARLNRVHLPIKGYQTPPNALLDFIQASRVDCKLTLARYLLDPAEVASRITGQLNSSRGVKDLAALNQPHVQREIDHYTKRLPRFETEIVRRLCEGSDVFWVSSATGSEINSLVEYPLNTVVAVVKPPGSNLELEIKRAGVKGERPLDAVYYLDGWEVPPTHRLWGGSMAYYLRWEAGTAADLSKIYRLIHQKEAPISRTLSVTTIYAVPVNGHEQHVVRYFSDCDGGRDPDEMRAALRYSIEAFYNETRVATPSLGGDLGLATQFLGHVVPSQSILAGTSSFRLDRLADYLSPQGADIYFARGHKRPFTENQARQFADELLEEVLGLYTPPGISCEDYGQYVDAALSQSQNRAAADRNYLAMLREIGEFWGTLLGMRSYSYGESFVARNVGIKSLWEKGEWRVKLVFMDHDVMYMTGRRSRDFHPLSAIPGMAADDRHVWGFRNARGEVELLREIYRVDSSVESQGLSSLRDELRTAYRKTQDEICHNERARGFFHRPFVDRLRDWDEIVEHYLSIKNDRQKVEAWKEQTELLLRRRGYSEALVEEYLLGIERHHSFLGKYSFLY